MSPVNPRFPPAEGSNGHHDHFNGSAHEDASLVDLWGQDDALREEMRRLAAENQQLMASAGLENGPANGHADGALGGAAVEGRPGDEGAPEENVRLRARVEELEQLVVASTQQAEQVWAEQQKEYEALLEEKSEVIRALHLKFQELRETAAAAPQASPRAPAEDMPDSKDELQALKEEVERERRQLREDEESLMQQMKQMELTMSRERVELARQRSELQRLHNDFQHELELASRDATLRERLAGLQRRHQEVMNQKGAAPSAVSRPASTPNLSPPVSDPTPPPKKGSSGLLRRLFGSSGQ